MTTFSYGRSVGAPCVSLAIPRPGCASGPKVLEDWIDQAKPASYFSDETKLASIRSLEIRIYADHKQCRNNHACSKAAHWLRSRT